VMSNADDQSETTAPTVVSFGPTLESVTDSSISATSDEERDSSEVVTESGTDGTITAGGTSASGASVSDEWEDQ